MGRKVTTSPERGRQRHGGAAGRVGRGRWRSAATNAAGPKPVGLQPAGPAAAGVAEAIGFGLALAILALRRPGFVRLTGKLSTVACIASTWLLGSWWPHSALHRHFGLRVGPLVGIELDFHAGSAVAAAVLV
jgi:hypothetical protein